MGKTQALRALIKAQLDTVSGGTYHKHAHRDATFPYKVFSISRVNLGDLSRDDFDVCIDIYDRAPDTKTVDQIGDDIEALFNDANLPQSTILPTFFRSSRYPVEESDKLNQHVQMHFDVELYELEVTE